MAPLGVFGLGELDIAPAGAFGDTLSHKGHSESQIAVIALDITRV